MAGLASRSYSGLGSSLGYGSSLGSSSGVKPVTNYDPQKYQVPEMPKVDFSTNYNTIRQAGLDKLNYDYLQNMVNTTNNLNKRGMFGYSVANEDIGKVNYNNAMAQSAFEGQLAGLQMDNVYKQQLAELERQRMLQSQAQFQQKMNYDQYYNSNNWALLQQLGYLPKNENYSVKVNNLGSSLQDYIDSLKRYER